uniref:ATP synthase subunit a n=1 Tax=Polyphemus pediculus TaxID=77662 RepID=A0A7L7S131_9CRUS|nr:ATP synthase F0 subunit 6 [Polyphemus pediculus]
MMSNLFSIFDPSSSMFIPLNWVSSWLGLLFIPLCYWLSGNRLTVLFKTVSHQLHAEFVTLVGPGMRVGHTLVFISLFVFIMFNNLLGLLPYVFTSSSHLVMTLALAMPIWLGFMVFGWVNHTTHMLAHLVPLGTPTVLMPFMVLIETISNVIRPGTLAVRLAANMIAGHLLLVLLGNQGVVVSSYILGILLFVQILLLTLESAVAVIQAYVFAVLSTLYSSEVV